MSTLKSPTGTVYLVGTGPGAAGLITDRARRVVAMADAVVYDRLISPQLLGLAPSHAQFIFVGKRSGNHTLHQDDINRLLIQLAAEGKIVVRLKGGDPFVFGRGGEEGEACRVAGIDHEVVPGVSSAVAVPAYAGVPVTHRGVSTSFTVITGHECTDVETTGVWQQPGWCQGTIIILMGVGRLGQIVQRLLDLGRDEVTPAAIIERGTQTCQRTVTGTLSTICERAQEARISAPAIIVVGEVVRLRGSLEWFEEKPLMGQRILVAADTKEEAERQARAVEDLGGDALAVAVEHGASLNPEGVRELVQSAAGQRTRLTFLSIQGVLGFFQSLRLLTIDLRLLSNFEFVVANEEVAKSLQQHGMTADVTLSARASRSRQHPFLYGWTQSFHHGPGTAADLIHYDTLGVPHPYRLQALSHNTEQLTAMWSASNEEFDACWATSSEALQFAIDSFETCRGKASFPENIQMTSEDSTVLVRNRGTHVETATSPDQLARKLCQDDNRRVVDVR